jgi:putative copper export protein
MPGETFADVLLIASRLLWYAGILGVIGAGAFRLFILPAVRLDAPFLDRAIATAGLAGATILLAGTLARLYAQAYVSFGLDEPLTAELTWIVATDLPPWSSGWTAQFAAAAFSLVAFAVARTGSRAAWMLAFLAALAVAASAPLTGHAVAQARWHTLPVALQAAHVLGAGVWIGGLFVMVVVGLSVLARHQPSHSPQVAALVNAFSPFALGGAALLAATGVGTTVLYLHTAADLWATWYGRTLMVKIAAIAGVAVAGFVNWQRVRPRLSSPGAADVLRRMVTIELLLALAVLAITAVLVGLPQPGDAGDRMRGTGTLERHECLSPLVERHGCLSPRRCLFPSSVPVPLVGASLSSNTPDRVRRSCPSPVPVARPLHVMPTG